MDTMSTSHVIWFDWLPLPAVFLLTILFVLLAIGGGMGLGAIGHRASAGKAADSSGSVVGATLGLLAFILAFTFGMAASRYDARKQLLLDEVNAIGTAYLRAGLLPGPYQTEVRTLLREYVDVRARAAHEPATLAEGIARSEEIQNRLWSQAEQMTARNPASIAQGLFVQSLNEVIELHGKRVAVGLQYRIPSTIWLGLYVVAALAMIAVGYQFGQSRHWQITVSVLLALAFSAVLTLIADLDRAAEGTVRLNQRPLFELQQKLHGSS